MKVSLVIMAAGLGSRFGGNKQISQVGPHGEILMEYSIHDAIEDNRNISFQYFSWTENKQRELRRNGDKYIVSPWSLVWDDSNYYLIGYDLSSEQIRHYRVDKMLSVDILNSDRVGEEEYKKYDIASYSSAVFGMFGGKPERVTLSCNNRLANVMLDRFGSDTTLTKDGSDRFKITVNIVPSPVFLGWVISFGNEVEIISPDSVADEMKSLLDKYR